MNYNLFEMNLDIDDASIIKNKSFQKSIKRVLDIIISILLVTISFPVILLACIAIRAESTGSPIYKQTRFGYREKTFTVYKLRTMYDHSSDGNLAAPKADDTRVTKVGRLLRKTSIDELPQLFNVLKGDMSLLGPRAVPEKEIQLRINKMLIHHSDKKDLLKKAMRIRMLAKPGISGMAQAYGRSSLSVEEATGYDVYYVINYTLRLDLEIFFKSINAVLFQRGVN